MNRQYAGAEPQGHHNLQYPRPDALALLGRLLNASDVRLDQGDESARAYLEQANSLAVLAELLNTSEVQLCEREALASEHLKRAYSILEQVRERWEGANALPRSPGFGSEHHSRS